MKMAHLWQNLQQHRHFAHHMQIESATAERSNSQVLCRPIQTIGISPAAGCTLTTRRRQLIPSILYFSQAQSKDVGPNGRFTVNLVEFVFLAGLDNSSDSQPKALLNLLEGLRITRIQYRSIRDDKFTIGSCGIIESPEIQFNPNTREYFVSWRLPIEIAPQLLLLDLSDKTQIYQKFPLKIVRNIAKLNNSSEIALAEICWRANNYRNNHEKATPFFSVNEWARSLMPKHRSEPPKWNIFCRDVLNPAIKSVERALQIQIELIGKRNGLKSQNNRNIDEFKLKITDLSRANKYNFFDDHEGEYIDLHEDIFNDIMLLDGADVKTARLIHDLHVINPKKLIRLRSLIDRISKTGNPHIKLLVQATKDENEHWYQDNFKRSPAKLSIDDTPQPKQDTTPIISIDEAVGNPENDQFEARYNSLPQSELYNLYEQWQSSYLSNNPPSSVACLVKDKGLDSPLVLSSFKAALRESWRS